MQLPLLWELIQGNIRRTPQCFELYQYTIYGHITMNHGQPWLTIVTHG